jgi:hypothetical protein
VSAIVKSKAEEISNSQISDSLPEGERYSRDTLVWVLTDVLSIAGINEGLKRDTFQALEIFWSKLDLVKLADGKF